MSVTFIGKGREHFDASAPMMWYTWLCTCLKYK